MEGVGYREASLKLADTIASMGDPEGFLLDVAMSSSHEAFWLLVMALARLDGETRALMVLDTVVEANRREDDDARGAANRLFAAVRDC